MVSPSHWDEGLGRDAVAVKPVNKPVSENKVS